jgi:hypothetical protein
MPGLQSVEPGGQRFYACYWDRSFGHRLALESVAEVLAALVGSVSNGSSAKVQINYRLRYAHTRTRAAHSKLPVDPCATRTL